MFNYISKEKLPIHTILITVFFKLLKLYLRIIYSQISTLSIKKHQYLTLIQSRHSLTFLAILINSYLINTFPCIKQ